MAALFARAVFIIALKGQNMVAQGKALGRGQKKEISPERGEIMTNDQNFIKEILQCPTQCP
jgi:hypothetical protein